MPPRCWRCSAPTAPARRRRSRCARASSAPMPAPSRCSGWTRSPTTRGCAPRIGVMLQGGGGYPAARAGEMLNLVASYAADPLDPQWLLDTLGLTDAARTTYRRLSGGQQQRLALACALVGRPELVFLDEPTAGMDAQARLLVWELIDALRRDGVTVVLTTHQLKEAEELADRLVIIDRRGDGGRRNAGRVDCAAAPKASCGSARRRGSTCRCWSSALPEDYQATEATPGEYLVEGHGRSAGAGDGHGVVRPDRRAGHRSAGRAAQPGGRVPRADRPGVAIVTQRESRFSRRAPSPPTRGPRRCPRCWPRSSAWS